MLTQLLSSPFSLIYWLLAFGISLSVHEAAHAFMADRLGDPTARLNGRLTLNPLAHIDPLGTLMLLFFRFGWGKPVPIDPYNLREPRRDAGLVSLAGPASNLILATLLSFVLRLLPVHSSLLTILLAPIITLNVSWAIFNLLPLHPLDGGKILVGFLPKEIALSVEDFLQEYSLILLIFIIFPVFGYSVLSSVVWPIVNFILNLLLPQIPLI